jgi:DNA-binding transcriptional ArsR family regulator
MSLPAISKHLKVLEKAGLIRRGREAQWEPIMAFSKPPVACRSEAGLYPAVESIGLKSA